MTSMVPACLAAAFVVASIVPGYAAERLNDKQAKAAIDNVDHAFDKWKDSLERRNLDEAVIRNAAGTIDVQQFLKDFEKEIDRVKDRLDSKYAAGPEVTQLLRTASDVDRRAQASGRQPEWTALATQLSALAAGYNTEFPLPTAGSTAARLTDGELASSVSQLEKDAKKLSGEVDKAMKKAGASDADRKRSKQSSAALASSAKQASKMFKAGTASAAQAESLLTAARAEKDAASGLDLSPAGKAALMGVDRSAAAVATAFGLPW